MIERRTFNRIFYENRSNFQEYSLYHSIYRYKLKNYKLFVLIILIIRVPIFLIRKINSIFLYLSIIIRLRIFTRLKTNTRCNFHCNLQKCMKYPKRSINYKNARREQFSV